jgi:hypothetical protein
MIIHTFEQRSYEWALMRRAKITGTSIKDIFKSDYLEAIDKLIAEEETEEVPDDSFVTDAMQRGIDLEPVAINEYSEIRNLKVTPVGFLQNQYSFPWFGISSDGLIYQDDKLIGAIEVKCPDTKTHVKRLRQNKLPNEYKYQVMAHFIVSDEIEWVDFISFDPRFVRKPIFIYRTYRTDCLEQLEEMRNRMFEFEAKLSDIKEQILF